MIRVLKDWSEVGTALGYLTTLGTDKLTRSYHTTPVKNWDLAQIAKLLNNKDKNIRILDIGCGGSNVLRFCYKNKFTNTYGLDTNITFQDRWQQLMYFKNNGYKLPYHLSRQSVTKTNFSNNFFDLLICLSVIEHNVNADQFFSECSRILKKNGILYLSTDYWEDKIDTSDAPVNYGTDSGTEWTIFSKQEILNLITIARKYRLKLIKNDIPKVGERVVNWNTKDYTFISIVLAKRS